MTGLIVYGSIFFVDNEQHCFLALISDIVEAFVTALANVVVNGLYVGSMHGLKTMPRTSRNEFSIDVAQTGTGAFGLTKMSILPFVSLSSFID